MKRKTRPSKEPVKTKSPQSSKSVAPTRLPAPLSKDQVYHPCPVTVFKFKTTKELKSSHDIIAQERAIRAINMGLGIRRPGYNIYVAGIEGTGKTSVIRQFLEKWSADASPPPDWVYLYNFQSPENPRAIEMPRGEGKVFKKKMEAFVKTMKEEIPAALQSEDYENTINAYLSAANDRKAKLFSELEKLAKSMDFVIKASRMGIETVPVIEGRALTEKEYGKISDTDRRSIESKRGKLEPEVLDFARKIRGIERESREYIEKLRSDLGNQIVSALVDPLIQEYQCSNNIVAYLEQVREDVLEHLLDFVVDEERDDEEHVFVEDHRDKFTKYQVNVFLDNSLTHNAPVVIETNPTYYNLFGKIEKNVEHGMYLTDFTMIKSGSIHKANGGYLVLNALDIFRTPSIWDTLKRVLRNRMGFIEDMGEQYSLLPTSGLRPEAIPLDLKVILIGTDEIYHILFDEDEEFHKIFKIKADFDFKMPRTQKNIDSYVSFIATRGHLEGLLPFDRSAVATVVEYGSRKVEDQKLLSTQFGELKDLTIEADFIARELGAKIIKREHVQEALNQKHYRLNLQEQNLLDLVNSTDILLSVDGSCVGQINGLAVYDYGDYSFGKIGRITCTAAMREGGIINIERASRLSGKIHDKGIMILSGILNGILAKEKHLGLSASVCFEQNYGIIDGDSASVAELVAILSSMANIPIRQNYGITGSINQMGEVQSIGGVNEKVEGFHKTCKLIGKGKQYNVLIPRQNASNLMLHDDVQQSVASGFLRIYPISTINEAFELVTGVPLGLVSMHSTEPFAAGTALAMIHNRLKRLQKEADKHHDHRDNESDKGDSSREAARRRGRR